MKDSHAANLRKPDPWLLEAILVSIFWFLPFGIVAVYLGIQSIRKWSRGDKTGAALDAKRARRITIISFFAGILSIGYQLVYFYGLAKIAGRL